MKTEKVPSAQRLAGLLLLATATLISCNALTDTQVTTKSSNNTLLSLAVSPGTLTPPFSPSVLTYTVDGLAHTDKQLTISASPYDNTATIRGVGTKSLSTGTNEFTVSVTAQNGVSRAITLSAIVPSSPPPSVPTGLGVASSNGQNLISWSSVPGAASYNLYWSMTSGVTSLSGTKIAGVTSPHAHTGLTNNSPYFYVVTAVSSTGESSASAQVSGTPQVASTSAPTGLSAAAGDKAVVLAWTAVTGATGYNVYWDTTPGVTTSTGVKIAIPSGTTYTHAARSNGTTYYYIVTAVNEGGESSASTEASAKPQLSASGSPSGVSAVSGESTATVNWTAVTGATSYNLYWDTKTGVTTSSGTKISGVTSPYEHTGRTNGTTYYYIVTAVNAGGESSASSETSAKPQLAIPTGPTGVTGATGDTKATISWTAVTGATSYNLYWDTKTGVTTSSGTKISGVTSPYEHTGRTNGTTYYYIVTAVNAGGESSASSETSVKPLVPRPTAPSSVATTTADRTINVSWASVNSATSYNVYWSTSPGVTPSNGTKVTTTQTQASIAGLNNETTYYLALTAVNGSNESIATTEISVDLPSFGTLVSGLINSDTTWKKTNSPYVATNSIRVMPGVTLTIEDGVEVRVKKGYFQVDGSLVADGSAAEGILFHSNTIPGTNSDWTGFNFRSTGGSVFDSTNNYLSGSKLNHVTIQNAATAVYVFSTGLLLSNSKLDSNGVAIELRKSVNMIISNNVLSNNNTAIYSLYESYTGDSYGAITDTYIDSNTFSKNGTGINLNLNQVHFAGLSITSNIFSSNTGSAITIGGGGYGPYAHSILIKSNTISMNGSGISLPQFYNSGTNGTVVGTALNPIETYPVKVQKNTLTDNLGDPLTVSYNSRTNILVEDNLFSGNSGSLHWNQCQSLTTFQYNTVKDNSKGVVLDGNSFNSFATVGVDFLHNSFQNNGTGSLVAVNYGNHTFSANNFSHKGSLIINNQTAGDLLATGNYWGSDLASYIQTKVYDGTTDISKGLVKYSPFLAVADQTAGVR